MTRGKNLSVHTGDTHLAPTSLVQSINVLIILLIEAQEMVKFGSRGDERKFCAVNPIPYPFYTFILEKPHRELKADRLILFREFDRIELTTHGEIKEIATRLKKEIGLTPSQPQ